ncbi:unnamed protein product [Chondrus crispus]|uniref:Uncharacterized protein n=1 Tax=Chondrus crispus TaxID=2769 RepID=R7QIX3_CHOCR|nr:unnamed protein product [Chondrus crispus]CDF37713.1 unnamed protein product [Chondrus crispus]|eukprot:XP_005717584.1 unnamed protein product [Chondrus crispus]
MEREKPGALAKGAMPAGALDGRRAAFERDKAEATALVRGKVAAFAGDEEPRKAPARGGRDKTVEKARGGEEDQSAKGDRRDEEAGDEEAAVKKPVGLGQRFAMFEGGTAAAENGAAHVKVKAKVDEGDRPVAKAVAKAVGKVPAASGDGGTVKGKTSTSEAGVVQELREVKKQNEELLKRLVELTTAFKRLEKNREALQGRLAKLEKK